MILGGNVRVGLEDNIYYKKGELAKSNAQLVARIVRIARELGKEPCTPDEARQILGIKTDRLKLKIYGENQEGYMANLFRVDDKVAVVIGGAGGIGEALGIGLAEYGAKVVIAGRNLEKSRTGCPGYHGQIQSNPKPLPCKLISPMKKASQP